MHFNYLKAKQHEPKLTRTYVLENDLGHIKIGRTTDFEKRKQSLSGSNGGGCCIMYDYVSDYHYVFELESMLHQRYARYRVPGTEWFKGIAFIDVVENIQRFLAREDIQQFNEEERLRAEELNWQRLESLGCL